MRTAAQRMTRGSLSFKFRLFSMERLSKNTGKERSLKEEN